MQRAGKAQVMLVVRPRRRLSGRSRRKFTWRNVCRLLNTSHCYSTSIPSQHQQQSLQATSKRQKPYTEPHNSGTSFEERYSIKPSNSPEYQVQQPAKTILHNALRNTSPRHAPHLGPPNDRAPPLRPQPRLRQALPSTVRRHVPQAWADVYSVSHFPPHAHLLTADLY